MNAIYWKVTTSVINADWTYKINVESNISDLEYRNCDFVQQPWFNTFPKVWDTVLLLVVEQWQYAILGIVSYYAKEDLIIWNNSDTIRLKWWDIRLTWWAITANGEDLNIDRVG